MALLINGFFGGVGGIALLECPAILCSYENDENPKANFADTFSRDVCEVCDENSGLEIPNQWIPGPFSYGR